MDLFIVPTIGFDLLYALVIVRLARRELVWINVTASKPNRGMVAHQITEAFPWNQAPRPADLTDYLKIHLWLTLAPTPGVMS
jgi:hypothetical protein